MQLAFLIEQSWITSARKTVKENRALYKFTWKSRWSGEEKEEIVGIARSAE